MHLTAGMNEREERRGACDRERTIRGVHDTSPGVSTLSVPPNRS